MSDIEIINAAILGENDLRESILAGLFGPNQDRMTKEEEKSLQDARRAFDELDPGSWDNPTTPILLTDEQIAEIDRVFRKTGKPFFSMPLVANPGVRFTVVENPSGPVAIVAPRNHEETP